MVDAEDRLAGDDLRKIAGCQGLPDDLVVLGVLELDGRRHRAAASWRPSTPVRRSRWTVLLEPCASLCPNAVVSSAAGTFQVCAAAATNIARAPRADLPHRNPVGRSRRAAARDLAAVLGLIVESACTILTSFQSTSSSSAISIGSMVLTPWPTSGFLAMMVTVPSAAIFT